MRGFLSVLLVIACTVPLVEGACAESLEPPAAAGKPADDEPAPPPPTAGDRAKRDEAAGARTTGIDEPAPPPATDGDRAERDEEAAAARVGSQVGNAPTAELAAIDSMCLMLESAATANELPLEFFARVIWEESRFQPNTVGPMTRSGHRAQGIAQFMPYTANERGLLDPFNPETALPKAAEFLAELRSEFGNLGLAAAAYNAGPGRVRDFLGGRGGMPAQTRNYVRAVTGRSVDEWAALGREGGKDRIPKPTSCGQLAALLKEQPSFFIGKTGSMREAALSPQESPDWRNTSPGQNETRRAAGPTGSVATSNRHPLQLRSAASLPSTDGAARRPKTSPPAASAELGSSSAKPGKSGKSIGAAGRSTSVASTPSDSRSASSRLQAVSPKGSARENSATRAAARSAGSVATSNRHPSQLRSAASLPSTDRAARRPKTSPPAASAESGSASAKPGKSGKSIGAAGRSTSVASTLSDSRSASSRLQALSPKGSARENSATRAAARSAGSVATRNRNPLQVRTAASLPSTDGAARRPKTSPPAASAESGSSSAKPGKSGKSIGAAGRSTSVASTPSDSRSASSRLQAVSPKGSARENSATRVAARPAGSVAKRNALLPTTGEATRQPKSSPPTASGEFGKLVGQARQTRKIGWCPWAVDVRGVDAVGLEVDVGPVTGGFAEGDGARKRRYRPASKSHADLPRVLARSIARAQLLKIGAL